MNTIKLYRQDIYLKETTAKILEIKDYNGNLALILDQTLFFPGGGGQTCDLGQVNNIPLQEVLEYEDEILHIIADDRTSIKNEKVLHIDDEVVLKLDWDRRFDNMQRHSGEHIFSRSAQNTQGCKFFGALAGYHSKHKHHHS